MGEICLSGSTRERGAAVIGPWTFNPVLSSLLYCLRGLVTRSIGLRALLCKALGVTCRTLKPKELTRKPEAFIRFDHSQAHRPQAGKAVHDASS